MLNIAEKMQMALLLQSFRLKFTFLLIQLEQMYICHPCKKMLTHHKAGSIFFFPIYCVTQHQLGNSVTQPLLILFCSCLFMWKMLNYHPSLAPKEAKRWHSQTINSSTSHIYYVIALTYLFSVVHFQLKPVPLITHFLSLFFNCSHIIHSSQISGVT